MAAATEQHGLKPLPLVRAEAERRSVLDATHRRRDGRSVDEFRRLYMRTGIVAKAAGSAYTELAATKVLCSVFGPHATEGREYLQRGQIECSLRFASFARSDYRRQSQAASAEDRTLAAALTNALSASVQLERYPKSVIAVNVLVLQDDGGALAAAITCASLALGDASIQLYDLVAASACAVVDGQVLLDCCVSELQEATGQTTVGQMCSLNQVTLLQHDGAVSFKQTSEALQLALDGCAKVHGRMQSVLAAKARHAASQRPPPEHDSELARSESSRKPSCGATPMDDGSAAPSG